MESWGELRANMKSLVGNGQPGRVGKLEKKVERHDKYLYMLFGVAALLNVVIKYGIELLPKLLGSSQ
jgi:hypothetical protein